ncbi:hypothetical protein EBR96_05860 [bacterium]|nr:hypothetical protein [bacterium]
MSAFDSVRFNGGRPLLSEISADKLNAILREIKKNRPRGERGITVREAGDATYIGLAATLATKTTTPYHPFQVLLNKKPDDSYVWGVHANSKVFTNLSPNLSPETIENLLPEDEDIDSESWLTIDTSNTDYIYLEQNSEGAIRIDSVGNGGSFDPEADINSQGAFIQINADEVPPEFVACRKIIAKCTIENPEDAPQITQGIYNNQLLQDVIYGGTLAKYFFDFSMGMK